ncbi:hypothetical protein BV898_09614 [Hypsibius exemplaris]|uniref:G-protein coupled receptors family 1 profile domain-containing protein n=1 Tax=Hypsibius exemplaris TaxID=2072580 RepID=A0A1W0WM58_HYPEX|nr:hypothetical protein BV898_09614 [Hypsibius exemplaris]
MNGSAVYRNASALSLSAVNSTASLFPNTSSSSSDLWWIFGVMTTNTVGIFANILLLLAVIVHKPLRRSSSSALIIHCIAIDLYTTTVSVPSTTIPFYLGPTHQLPKDFCKYQPYIAYLAWVCGMDASSLLSLHRFVAALFPNQFPRFRKTAAIAGLIAAPWIASILINLFPTLEMGSRFIASSVGGCTFVAGRGPSTVVTYMALGYYLPTAVMGLNYTIVLTKTMLDVRRRPRSPALRRRLEITRTLWLSFVWHCMTIYPPAILTSTFPVLYASNRGFKMFLKWLGGSYSAINPVQK